MKPGDLVEIACDNGYFVLPMNRVSGIVVEVREIPVESWCDGKTQVVPKRYADLLIAGEMRLEIPCWWLGLVSEAR